jgi:hypothetical protein
VQKRRKRKGELFFLPPTPSPLQKRKEEEKKEKEGRGKRKMDENMRGGKVILDAKKTSFRLSTKQGLLVFSCLKYPSEG